MEKVKLTQEQADRIEFLREKKVLMLDFVQEHVKDGWSTSSFNCLNELSTEEFVDSLCGDYEVEPEFKVGDWVAHKVVGDLGEIIKTRSTNYADYVIVYKGYNDEFPWNINSIRHATYEEIAREKQKRTENKLDGLLLVLTDDERIRLRQKLNCEQGKA